MAEDSQVFQLDTTLDYYENTGVCFDPEELTLIGFYKDELSSARARKIWAETLEDHFLLEPEYDFDILNSRNPEEHSFSIQCSFRTACARYAFWRLTNSQAPEAQYLIETAHIPQCESRQDDILRAPDLRSVRDGEPLISQGCEFYKPKSSPFRRFVEKLVERFTSE